MRSIRVPERLWDDAKGIADERGESISDCVREALESYVRRGSWRPEGLVQEFTRQQAMQQALLLQKIALRPGPVDFEAGQKQIEMMADVDVWKSIEALAVIATARLQRVWTARAAHNGENLRNFEPELLKACPANAPEGLNQACVDIISAYLRPGGIASGEAITAATVYKPKWAVQVMQTICDATARWVILFDPDTNDTYELLKADQAGFDRAMAEHASRAATSTEGGI